jgi:hypothetical protein
MPLEINSYMIFGRYDNLTTNFNSSNWTIMNKKWSEFKLINNINEIDLWNNTPQDKRTLMNAKLYPVIHLHLSPTEIESFCLNFWLHPSKRNKLAYSKWRESTRFSIEDIINQTNTDNLFTTRRHISNIIKFQSLTNAIIDKRPINYISEIHNPVYDGYGEELLEELDKSEYYHLIRDHSKI